MGSINRIRLEFKVVLMALTPAALNHVLIESDWNLKLEFTFITLLALPVLIESDWNLKIKPLTLRPLYSPVLIESDWNLK